MFGFLKRSRVVRDGIPGTLTGSFDVRGNQIVGWVEKVPIYSNAGTRVEVIRGCSEVVAACDATEQRGSEKMPFTMPIDGRFTIRELAREDVRLTVQNLRGDTGNLNLAGATRLEFIREYLGVPSEPVLELDFTRTGNAAPFLGEGWSHPEKWPADEEFTWTLGENSIIRLPHPLRQGSYRLRMRYRAYLPPFVPAQLMEVYLDEQPVASFSESDDGTQFRELRFDWNDAPVGTSARLRLHHPYAARPKDSGLSKDERRVAYAFRRLTIVRELAA